MPSIHSEEVSRLAPTPLVLSHWHKLIESLEAIAARQMPDTKVPQKKTPWLESRETG